MILASGRNRYNTHKMLEKESVECTVEQTKNTVLGHEPVYAGPSKNVTENQQQYQRHFFTVVCPTTTCFTKQHVTMT